MYCPSPSKSPPKPVAKIPAPIVSKPIQEQDYDQEYHENTYKEPTYDEEPSYDAPESEDAPPQEDESNSLLASIRRGKALRTVQTPPPRTHEAEQPVSDDLAGLLKKAMAGRLSATNGEDDWSEEEPDDDDWD